MLASKRESPEAERYGFVPYHYGPYSSDLKADVQRLLWEGLAGAIPVPGYTRRYQLTDAGLERARHLLHEAPVQTQQNVYAIKQRITAMSFNDLLRDVYSKYPEFATESVFNG